jgi:hypothetical protein
VKEKPALSLRFLRYDTNKEKIFIVDLPLPWHESCIGQFDVVFAPHSGVIRPTRSITASFIHIEPDGSWTPRGRAKPGPRQPFACNPQGSPYPTVILEVGASESLPQLRADAAAWLSPDRRHHQDLSATRTSKAPTCSAHSVGGPTRGSLFPTCCSWTFGCSNNRFTSELQVLEQDLMRQAAMHQGWLVFNCPSARQSRLPWGPNSQSSGSSCGGSEWNHY